jgi:hypothetical protein
MRRSKCSVVIDERKPEAINGDDQIELAISIDILKADGDRI